MLHFCDLKWRAATLQFKRKFSSPQFYFMLQMRLNDVEYFEVVYRYENFDRERTGGKFRDKKRAPAYVGPF
jgi:hypothetical protein